METHVPLISTRTKGPLGLVHLPRLWLKMRLSAKGKLADEYRAGERGFDGLLLEALGIDSTAAVAFVSASQPGYLAFEAWVKENAKPGSLTSASSWTSPLGPPKKAKSASSRASSIFEGLVPSSWPANRKLPAGCRARRSRS